MQLQNKTALIAGASGLVGGHCLRLLLEDASYSTVIALVRKEIPLIHPRLRQITVRFDDLAETLSSVKCDDVFCCLGTTIKKAGSQANFRKVDFDYPVALARAALQNGARQFLIVTAMGADKSSFIFYNRVKGETEEAIKKTGFPSVHVFRPSLLLGERSENRAGEKIGTVLFNVTAPFFIGPLRKYRAIEGKAVAGAMTACARENSAGVFIHESDDIQSIYNKNYK